jgi:hypothetical protein
MQGRKVTGLHFSRKIAELPTVREYAVPVIGKEVIMKRINHILTLASAVLFMGLMLLPLGAIAKKPAPNPIVDCDAGQSVQVSLDAVKPGYTAIIFVKGTCVENINIARDDITVEGNNEATIVGTVAVYGGRRIHFRNISLTGPGLGMDVFSGDVSLNNVLITGNEGIAGIAVNQNGFIYLQDSTVSENIHHGVLALNGGVAEIRNSALLKNMEAGLRVNGNSHAVVLDGSVISGNTSGIHAWAHSTTFIHNSAITANTDTGIWISKGSAVLTFENVDVSTNTGAGVYCEDTESSFENAEPVEDPINCTGFN